MTRSEWSTPTLARLHSGAEASGYFKTKWEIWPIINDGKKQQPEDDTRAPS